MFEHVIVRPKTTSAQMFKEAAGTSDGSGTPLPL